MSMENNYVGINYCGIVGGEGNTVTNFLYNEEGFFGDGTKYWEGNEYMHFLMLFMDENDACRDAVTQRLDNAYAAKQYPLFVEITDLVDICTRIVYFNGGADDDKVRKLINRFFTIACISLGFEYNAKIVRVGSRYYFEMFPRK